MEATFADTAISASCLVHITRVIVVLAFLGALSACGSGSSNAGNTATATASLAISTLAPVDIRILSSIEFDSLHATATIDSDIANSMEMSVGRGTGSATLTLSDLSTGSHPVTITYDYVDSSGTLILATSTMSVDISPGTNSLNYNAAGFDLDSYDDDGDSTSNAHELVSGRNPRVNDGLTSLCVLGSSTFENCTLN
jgi:hypothetical protein